MTTQSPDPAEDVMALHTAMIDGVQVAGYRYIVYGPSRGLVSTHRTKRASLRLLALDSRAKRKAGEPSDARVYRWRDVNGWIVVEYAKDASTVLGAEANSEQESGQ